jgi:cysteine desulfurase
VPDPVYLDHAATTPLRPEALDAMMPFLTDAWGNASSVHRWGRAARSAVEEARVTVADVLGCEPAQIVFTSGGTESDNLALRGALPPHSRLVTGAAEHEAVINTAHALERQGTPITLLAPADVTPDGLAAALGSQAAGLVSLMYVNNESGAVADVAALAATARAAGALFHTDAVQAAGLFALDVDALGVDLLSLSSHKFGGPKGAGILYVRGGVDLQTQATGGAQERGRRGGTENVAAVVGMARALELADAEREATAARIGALRDDLRSRLVDALGERIVVVTPDDASPHILNVAFPPRPHPTDGEMLILGMDLEGVAVSSGSACTSGTLRPSHVLSAMGLDDATARAAVRFSLGSPTKRADIDRAADALVRVAGRV